MSRIRSLLLPAIVAISAVAHAGAFLAVRGEPRPAAKAPSLLEIAVAPPPAPPPPPSREPDVVDQARVAPRPARTTAPRPIVKRPAPPAAQPPAPTPAQPEPPADFTGTTLTNDSSESWAPAAGNGESMAGPIGAPRATRAPAKTSETPGPRVTAAGPPVVALADLSRPPHAPNLNDALAHNYPVAARQRGVAGKAVVRARIGADGKARVLDIVSESFDGFGVACRRTLDGSRWEPPQDRGGQAVDTVLTYTCRFEVGS